MGMPAAVIGRAFSLTAGKLLRAAMLQLLLLLGLAIERYKGNAGKEATFSGCSARALLLRALQVLDRGQCAGQKKQIWC
jgi:hypothetical protein